MSDIKEWPEIPSYLVNPIVFKDKNLGTAMVATWLEDEQWIFRVHDGQWCSVRPVGPDDPPFIEPLNKPEPAQAEGQFSPNSPEPRCPKCQKQTLTKAAFFKDFLRLACYSCQATFTIDKSEESGQLDISKFSQFFASPRTPSAEQEKIIPVCPRCEKELEKVTYPGGALNEDQWDAVKAGDYRCLACPDNGRANKPKGAYWWENEVKSRSLGASGKEQK